MTDRTRTPAQVLALGARELARLFDACADHAPLTLADLVPHTAAPFAEVIHDGKNSLFAFNRFQKRFCRPPGEQVEELWGYNEQVLRRLTGPGYFVVHRPKAGVGRGELAVDYRRLPSGKPSAWPPIASNSVRLSRFVYGASVDILRRVSEGVSIGRVYRDERAMDAWFALVRRTPQ
jgi:hypothetical protein